MSLRNDLIRTCGPLLKRNQWIKENFKNVDKCATWIKHSVARVCPTIIRAEPSRIWIAITSTCNFKCKGCEYGRTFMTKQQLAFSEVCGILEDANKLGVPEIVIYGGEPLTHPDLIQIIKYSRKLGQSPQIVTNGLLLRSKADELYEAGIRGVGLGFYGVGDLYDDYVQIKDAFTKVEEGIAYVRKCYNMNVTLNWLFMRPTCSIKAVQDIWEFCEYHSLTISPSLIHYNFPYFIKGSDNQLQFDYEDRIVILEVVSELIRLNRIKPGILNISERALRSIPDWLLKKENMRIPCVQYRDVWVGADGSVHMCQMAQKLGNIHNDRLIRMLYTRDHHQSARDAFNLNCPNCFVSFNKRIDAHSFWLRRKRNFS
ncbi:MAG: radical SAM protein [Colwellia sp.]|nr:radical SAM protein [Colwellia sp.]